MYVKLVKLAFWNFWTGIQQEMRMRWVETSKERETYIFRGYVTYDGQEPCVGRLDDVRPLAGHVIAKMMTPLDSEQLNC